MRLFTTKINLFLIIAGLFLLFLRVQPVQAAHQHGMSPRDGYVKTPTGAPVAGITVVEYSDTCPSEYVRSVTLPQCAPPLANCHSERRTVTDASGYFYFAPMTPPQPADACNDLNVFWRFTCSNPDVYYKILTPQGQQVQGVNVVPTAHAAESSASASPQASMLASPSPAPSSECPPVKHETSNIVESISTPITCNPPPACNTTCQKSGDCIGGVRDGCTTCVEGVCKPPPACNTACERDGQCVGAKDGCTSCAPSDSGSGKVCRPPAACNVACTRDDQCAGSKDGCNICSGGVCKKPPACNDSCTNAADCAKSVDGCTACIPGNSGTGNVCAKPPACNSSCVRDDQCVGDAAKDGCTVCEGGTCKAPACGIACTKDTQCAGAKDGCIVCMAGVCKTPPSCGTACTTKADCANPKDGCSECLEGTCTDYNDNMCKCDGIVADMSYPSNAFKFEAFGKVEGADTKKAEIADITFRMTKDNQVIAKSNPITPEVVENSAIKMRFKAAWQTVPPAVDKNATYRVFADVRCKPKKIVASANQTFTPSEQLTAQAETVKLLPVPKGTQLLADAINQISKLLGRGNDLITKEALAQFTQTSPAPTSAGNQLQLKTLNFIKMMDTDNCRFVMWKFDETLF